MECKLCKTILHNNDKNLVIKFNDENYCIGCYEVSILFDINDTENKKEIKKEIKEIKEIKNINREVKIKNNFVCPKCKIPMEKNCSKCKLKNPLWR